MLTRSSKLRKVHGTFGHLFKHPFRPWTTLQYECFSLARVYRVRLGRICRNFIFINFDRNLNSVWLDLSFAIIFKLLTSMLQGFVLFQCYKIP